MKTYLLKVRQYDIVINNYEIKVYKVTTDNVYRVIGKIYCTALEEIKWIYYSLWCEKRENFWREEGYEIIDYHEPILSEEED